jgi:uncharacterized protein
MIEAAIAVALLVGAYHENLLPPLDSLVVESMGSSASVSVSEEILSAAKVCAAKRTRYRMDYPVISYPAGDVPLDIGLCCDVVVRSLRAAGVDLQQLVYEDGQRARSEYLGANRRTRFNRPLNRSWVHRRTANLNLFLKRHAIELPTKYDEETADTWQPGDVVIYIRKGWETWHTAIVSDVTSAVTGCPLVLDAWSQPGYASESHSLMEYGPVGGHYRIPESLRQGLSEEHVAEARQAWFRYVVGVPGSQVAQSESPSAFSQDYPARNSSSFFSFLSGR